MIADLVSFDVTGLVVQPSSQEERIWANKQGLGVLLSVGRPLQTLPATEGDEAAMVAESRQLVAELGAGLVEMTFPRVDGRRAKRMVLKMVTDATTGHGRRFRGVLEIPIVELSVVLRVDCEEAGTTGFRETFVLQRLFASGALTIQPARAGEQPRTLKADGTDAWLVDPRDPTPAHLALNVSDDRQYDADFPNHPLTLVREFMDRAERSMSLAPELKVAPPFPEGSRTQAKPWWKMW